MNSSFTLASFSDVRPPLVEKVKRDSERMLEKAKYVIILNEDGDIVQSSQYRTLPFGEKPFECLAVFAPVTYKGVKIPHAVVLEIGFNRFVPYAQTEYVDFTFGTIKALKARRIVAHMTTEALMKITPAIFDLIQHEVDSRMSTWKRVAYNQLRGSKKYPNEVPDLVYVRIPNNADVLHYGAMLYDLKWRTASGGAIWTRAEQIRSWLADFMKLRVNHKVTSGGYLDETVKRSTSMHNLAEKITLLQNVHGYTLREVDALHVLIDKDPDSPIRKLLKQVRTLHKVKEPDGSETFFALEKRYGQYSPQLQTLWTIRTAIHTKRNRIRQVHAKESLVLGVTASKALECAKLKSLTQANTTCSDDDIPF